MTIYHVTTEGDVEGRSTKHIAYATGDPNLIAQYFSNEKCYELTLTPLNLVHIDESSAVNRDKLLKEKAELENRLKEINNLIK